MPDGVVTVDVPVPVAGDTSPEEADNHRVMALCMMAACCEDFKEKVLEG